jgi:hypothetical protein
MYISYFYVTFLRRLIPERFSGQCWRTLLRSATYTNHERPAGRSQIASCLAKITADTCGQHESDQCSRSFDVLTEVKVLMLVVWVVTPCEGRCQRFGEIYCLHLQENIYNLKIKAVRFSETSLTKFKATWLCKPQDHSWVFSASILTKNFRRQIPLLAQKKWACQNFYPRISFF